MALLVDYQIVKEQFVFGLALAVLACKLFPEQANPAQQRLYPGQQLPHAKGLDQVIVSPHFKPYHPVDLVCSGRQDQDGRGHLPAQDAANLKAIQFRQHQVQNDQVRPLLPRHLQSCEPV